MTGFISSTVWSRVKTAFRKFHDDVEQEPVTWYQSKGALDAHYGDKDSETFNTIELTGLIEYNFRRSWPINTVTAAGTIDGEHCRLLLNKEYLRELGYLDSYGYFISNVGADKFKIAGKMYKPLGDSDVAQNSNTTLFATLILKREENVDPYV